MTTTLEPQVTGHCKHCGFHWAILTVAKGVNSSTHKGQRCPFCRSDNVRFTKEETR